MDAWSVHYRLVVMIGALVIFSATLIISPVSALPNATIIVDPTEGLLTDENGGSATFTIQLDSRPESSVHIDLSSSDPTEGSVSPDQVNLTPGNWESPQTVTVTGLPDGNADGDVAFTIVTAPAVSNDPNYDAQNPSDVSVTNLDDALPFANDDSAVTSEDTSITLDVLANDTGLEDTPITVEVVDAPTSGTASIKENNQIIYMPSLDFNGADSFLYSVCDGDSDCASAMVSVTVQPVNDSPQALDDTANTALDTQLLVDVLANDSDVDGDILLLDSFDETSAYGGVVTRDDGGTPEDFSDDLLSYMPPLGFQGTDAFSYTASDSSLFDSASVIVTVGEENKFPVAVDDSYMTDQNALLVVSSSSGVLVNDVDVNGTGLTALLVSNPTHGDLEFNADGGFSFTPQLDFIGSDSFTYKANDGISDSNIAIVSIEINEINFAPTADDDTYQVGQYDVLTIPAPGILGNDSDPNEDSLTSILEAGPTQGELVLNPDGSLAYTLPGEFIGADSFSYYADDGLLASNIATVTINVTDQIIPTITWKSPIEKGDIFETGPATVSLLVEASDNLGVTRVFFFRWDARDQHYYNIGSDTSSPYKFNLDAGKLDPGWNQIFARADDAAGNHSEDQYIWIFRLGSNIYMPKVSR